MWKESADEGGVDGKKEDNFEDNDEWDDCEAESEVDDCKGDDEVGEVGLKREDSIF